MKIIVPKKITASVIKSYNILENDHPVYDAATLYTEGLRVISNHVRYQAVVGDSITGISAWAEGTVYTPGQKCYVEATHKIYQANADTTGQYPPNYVSGNTPPWTQVGYVNRGVDLTDTNYWVELGPTNYYAMLDSYTDTATTGVTNADSSGFEIVIELDSSKANAIALFNCVGSYIDLECIDSNNNVVWFKRDWLIRRESTSWKDFFFNTASKVRKDTYQQFPMFYNTKLKITIFGATVASCGNIVIGATKNIGMTQFDPTLSIVDYSKKETNTFGVTYLSVGKYKKRTTINMFVENTEIDTIYRTFADLRATPAVFICDNSIDPDNMFEAMLIYGFYKDFSIVIPNQVLSDCSLEIEGLA